LLLESRLSDLPQERKMSELADIPLCALLIIFSWFLFQSEANTMASSTFAVE
jgi:hypothetical protein